MLLIQKQAFLIVISSQIMAEVFRRGLRVNLISPILYAKEVNRANSFPTHPEPGLDGGNKYATRGDFGMGLL